MGYTFDKETNKILETKPAVQSPTIWAASTAIVVGLIQIFPELAAEVLPLLSPQVAGIITVVSGVIVVLRKRYSANLPVKGLIKDD